MSSATKLLEHAVSTVALGPERLKKELMRLDSMLCAIPVAEYRGIVSGSFVAVPR